MLPPKEGTDTTKKSTIESDRLTGFSSLFFNYMDGNNMLTAGPGRVTLEGIGMQGADN